MNIFIILVISFVIMIKKMSLAVWTTEKIGQEADEEYRFTKAKKHFAPLWHLREFSPNFVLVEF